MGPRRRQFTRTASVALALLLTAGGAAMVAVPVGVASTAPLNVTGTWHSVFHCMTGSCAGQEKPDTLTLTQAQGSTSVSGTGGDGAMISGTLSGNTLVATGTRKGYMATVSVTIAENGLSWSGRYESNQGTSGTDTATREAVPSGLRASATQVLCNLQLALTTFTCAAEVGDASGVSPATVPTGTVKFTATSGTVPTEMCTLTTTPGSPNVSSCAVTYAPPLSGIPIGAAAPVTAKYSGDSVFAASTGLPGAGAGISPIASTVSSGPGQAGTTVSCPAGALSCPIMMGLTVLQEGKAIISKRGPRRTITIGSRAVKVPAGQSRKVTVSLNRVGRRLLVSHKRLSAFLTVSWRGVVIKTQVVKIKPLRKGR